MLTTAFGVIVSLTLRCILNITEEVLSRTMSPPSLYSTSEQTWAAIRNLALTLLDDTESHLLSLYEPHHHHPRSHAPPLTQQQQQHYYLVLSTVLCHVVSEECEQRKTYIGRILNLAKPVQHALMNIIKDHHEQRRVLHQRGVSFSASSVSSSPLFLMPTLTRSSTALGGSADSTYTSPPRSHRKRSTLTTPASASSYHINNSHQSPSADSLFSPPTRDSALEALVEEYRRKNTALQKELESSQASEAETLQKLQSMQQRHRKEMMQLETSLLDRETQLRETYETDIRQLEHCLLDSQKRLEQHEKSAQEVELARDQLDMFQHTQERLAEAEEKLRKYRERWEQAADLQTALTREQEAHTRAVEQCLQLEEQLQDLQPVSRQLEEYKSKWTLAQVEIAQLQADVKKFQTEHVMWNQKEVQMSQSVQAYQEQSDQLLQQLKKNVSEEGIELTANGSVVGEGVRYVLSKGGRT